MSVAGGLVADRLAYGAIAHEGAQRLKHRLMILRGLFITPSKP